MNAREAIENIRNYSTIRKNDDDCQEICELQEEIGVFESTIADLSRLCEIAEKGERVNAWKEKELQAIENAWELINSKLPENNAEIQLVRFAVRVAREITKSYELEGEPK